MLDLSSRKVYGALAEQCVGGDAKADKVENATSGHLAGLDSNGNLTDSGVSPTEDVTVEGNPITFDSPFEQDAKNVVVSVKPIQDLHGYDHPWVGGAGKNKCDWNVSPTANALSIALSPNTYTISAKSTLSVGNWYFRFTDVNDNYISSPSAVGLNGYTFAESGWIYGGSNSQVVTFTIPSDCKLLEVGKLNADGTIPAQIEVGSSATAFEPYSNICPISGIDEVEIARTGKNLWNPNDTVNGFLDTNGSVRSYAGFSTTNYRKCVANETYTLSYYRTDVGSEDGMRIAWYDANKNFIRRDGDAEAHTVGLKQLSATAPANAVYMRASMCTEVAYTENYQLERGTEATAYEPYKGHTTTIPLPSTLYDADVDVTNGSADSRFDKVIFDGTEDVSWQLNDANPNYTHIFADVSGYIANIPTTGGQLANTLFNEFKNKDGEWVAGLADLENGWLNMTLPKGIVSNVNDFKAWLANNPLQVCYELATPTTISFDPTDVELLEGTNVVSTNGEKVAVKYGRSLWQDIDDLKTDTEGKLDKSDVADVEGDTASRPYSVNEFMLRADGLYKVTQPIAQNASITASNTTKTTVGEVLTALLNA